MVLLMVWSPVALASHGGIGAATTADQSNSLDAASSDAALATDDSDNETDDRDKPAGGNDTDAFTRSAAASDCVDLAPFMYQGSNPP
ncbi:MAG: hypothetical protein ABEI11_01050, partial [Haloarculaceae archaeon]